MLQIIQINASYKPAYIYGGPTRSVSKLCEALTQLLATKTGTLEVLTTMANGATELPVNPGEKVNIDGVPVTYFQRLTKDHTHFSPALFSALQKKLYPLKGHNKTTIVHIHAWWNLISMISCYIARRNQIPVVLSPRGMLTAYTLYNRNSWYKKMLHNLVGKSLLHYCHIHATTAKEKEDVLTIIQPKSITIIPNLVDFPVSAENMRSERTGSPDDFKLLFLSRIEEKKGLELLFEALALSELSYILTIAGTGDETYIARLREKAVAAGISSKINWIGAVYDEKFNLLAENDMLCLTSYNENFANVVIESLSVGTPVLISDGVGLADYVVAKQLGWICNLEPAAIAKKLQTAFNDVVQRTRIRQKAPEIIRNDYQQEILAEKYMNLYQSILKHERV